MYVLSPPLVPCLQLLGLLPVSVNHLPLRGDVARFSWPRALYSALLVASFCIFFCHWLIMAKDETTIVPHTTFMITFLCSFFSTFFGAVVAIGVAAKSAKQKIVLIEKLREIDFLLQRKLRPARTKRVSLLFLGSTMTVVTLESIDCIYFDFDKHSSYKLFSFAVFQVLKIVILFGLVEVMEVVLAVRERFQLVNERVLEVVVRSRSKQLMWTVALPCVETFTMPQEMKMSIPGLSEIHWSLCCIVYDINAIYGFLLVTTMIHIFANLIFCPYFLFVLFSDIKRFITLIGFDVMWIIFLVAELYVLVLPCSLTVKEANKTVTIVTKLMGTKMAKPLFNQLETFADQLFHRDVEFTACGLFTLHTSIIVSVASAVTTYLAIVIQFQTSIEDDVQTTTEQLPVTGVTAVTSALYH